jgi:cell division transport system ATP-binding protein
MRLLQMAETPSAGEVRVSGFSSKTIRRREIPFLRRKLGVVFQDFRLLRDRTAEENVAFALEVTGTKRSTIGQRVNRVLTQVGLSHKAQSFPDELSGGERQRVAVARALANEPLVLLADEPTGNLDEWAARGVFELFREINSMGMTVLMATHDLDLVRAHPEYRVIELAQGQVVYDSAGAAVPEKQRS